MDQFIPFVITVLAIVFSDLLTGVLIGLICGVIFVIRTNHHSAFTLVHRETMYLLRFNKDASFVNKTELKTKLASLPERSSLIVDATKSIFIDSDIYDLFTDFDEGARHREIHVEYKQFHNKSQNYRRRGVAHGVL